MIASVAMLLDAVSVVSAHASISRQLLLVLYRGQKNRTLCQQEISSQGQERKEPDTGQSSVIHVSLSFAVCYILIRLSFTPHTLQQRANSALSTINVQNREDM
jgi:hypothetical protein